MKNKETLMGKCLSNPLEKKEKRLYVELHNSKDNTTEWVVICPFVENTENGKTTYMSQREINGHAYFKLVVDEGYCLTQYYYPVAFFTIKSIHIKD